MSLPRHVKVIRIALCCVALVVFVELLFYFYPPALVFAYALLGRSPFCSAVDTLHGGQTSLKLSRARSIYSRPEHALKLIEKDGAGFRRWATPHGDVWMYESSERVLAELLAQQESSIYGSGVVGVRRGDVVLDCGAHIGLFTKEALAAGASRVVAIEPGPENLECLRRNLAAEIREKRVIIYPKGVLDREGVLNFYTFGGNSAADTFLPSGSDASSKTYSVEVTTIDKLVSELGLDRVDFVKMDIKGSTAKALRGASATVNRYTPRLAISTEETSDNPAEIIPLVRSLHPTYKLRCGYCALVNGTVFPMVVQFYP